MNETVIFAVVGIASIIAVALGYSLASLRSHKKLDDLRDKYAELNSRLDEQRTTTSEKLSNVEKMRDGLEHTLSTLAPADADEAIKSDKDKFVQTLLQPLQDTLKTTDAQVKRITLEGKKAQQLIQQQMDILKAPQQLGRGSTREIADALGDTEARRHWGKNTLLHLLELTYMTDHCRSCGMPSVADENSEGTKAKGFPPCIIDMPDGRRVAIDTNSPLEPYVSVCEAPDASVRSWHLETHARKLRERIVEMSSRVYTSQFEQKPEILILMVLNDHYLTTALEIDNDLIRLAESHNVVLATPVDILNLLQTIFYGWRQQSFSADAQKIRQTGINMYRRFGTFIKLIAQLGSELSGVLHSYNRAVNVFESVSETKEAACDETSEHTQSADDENSQQKSA